MYVRGADSVSTAGHRTQVQCVMVKFSVMAAVCEPLEPVIVMTALVGAGVPGFGAGPDELPPPPPQPTRPAIMNTAIQ